MQSERNSTLNEVFSFVNSPQNNSPIRRNVEGGINLSSDPAYVDREFNNIRQAGHVRFHNQRAADSNESRFQPVQASQAMHNKGMYSNRCNTNPPQSEALTAPPSYGVHRRQSNSQRSGNGESSGPGVLHRNEGSPRGR